MTQESKVKRLLLTVVILDHVKWLHVLHEFFLREEAKDQFPLLFPKLLLNLLSHVSSVKTVAIFNDPSSSVVCEINRLRKIGLDCLNLLVGVELQETVLMLVAIWSLDEQESVSETQACLGV